MDGVEGNASGDVAHFKRKKIKLAATKIGSSDLVFNRAREFGAIDSTFCSASSSNKNLSSSTYDREDIYKIPDDELGSIPSSLFQD